MNWLMQRRPTKPSWMFSDLQAEAYHFQTLEDALREHKVYAETAIPAGTYELELIDSPHFGLDTIAIKDVLGFGHILMHGGTTAQDTKGCVIVGDQVDEEKGSISGAKLRHVLERLKQLLRAARSRGERSYLEIRNAPGDRYVDTGNVASTEAA